MDYTCPECDVLHRYACPVEVIRNREARLKERQERLTSG